jgi:2'-5' RNA ligase
MMTCDFETPDAIYKLLWKDNFPAITRGDVDIDPFLSNPRKDKRRGLTLIFRPSDELAESILSFVSEIKQIEPDQYFYDRTNLHFTVLPLFTATTDYLRNYACLPEFEDAVTAAVRDMPAFTIQITGLTVSRGAVLVCGYPDSETLNDIRNKLRLSLANKCLSDGLDKRYRLITAHSTVVRFSSQLRDPGGFSEFILENRNHNFGLFMVKELQLVKNDWFMTQKHTPIIARYFLHTI